MDVKMAFLKGELDVEIYIDQPQGFVVKGQERNPTDNGILDFTKPLFKMGLR